MQKLSEITSDLDRLYSITGEDWVLSLSHTLTEPTCPTAVIHPEGWNISRYRVDMDSIEESLTNCVAMVRAEVFDRKVIGSCAPYSESDDGIYAGWLDRRAAGSDEQLPDKKPLPPPEEFEWILDGFLRKYKEQLSEHTDWREGGNTYYLIARIRNSYMDNADFDHEAAKAIVLRKLDEVLGVSGA